MEIYILIGTHVVAFCFGFFGKILFFHYKRWIEQKEENKLAKEQADKEYDRFKTVEKKMPELFDAFRAKLKKDSGFKCFYYDVASNYTNYCDATDWSNIFFEALLVPRYKQAPLEARQLKKDLEHEKYITQRDGTIYYLYDSFIELLLKETKK